MVWTVTHGMAKGRLPDGQVIWAGGQKEGRSDGRVDEQMNG